MAGVQPTPSALGGKDPIKDASVLDYKEFCPFPWDAKLYQKPAFV